MMNLNRLTLPFLFIIISGCSSEYGPDDIEISDKGAFVENGSSSLIDGTVIIEKVTGESLTVEFEDGLPSGEVEMRNADDTTILKSNFVAKKNEGNRGRGFFGGFNEMFELTSASLSTRDYLGLFEQFSEYDGSYFEIDQNNRKTEGNYTSGEKSGRWQEYCENQQLESDRSYKQVTVDGKLSTIKVGKELMNRCDGEVLLSATRDDQGRLQGEYIETASNLFSRSKDPSAKPKPKYQRNYKDGELDGEQKEYDRYGLIKLENNYVAGVKNGVEKSYSSNQDYSTKELSNWLNEVKHYSNGQLNGEYTKYDSLDRNIQSGQYQDDLPVGLWTISDYNKHHKQLVDYDPDNFIIDKAQGFKEACSLPKSEWVRVDWSANRQGKLSDCEYYVENSVVDINKKIALGSNGRFDKKSSNWTYPAIVAAPETYEYMKKHGLKTRVSNSIGRTRLHICIEQLGQSNKRYPRCTADQAISYADDVDMDAVSNNGTALHLLAKETRYNSNSENINRAKLKIANALIEKGANIDQLNHKGSTALMYALRNAQYDVAEALLDAGASVEGKTVSGANTLQHFFITDRNRWRKDKVSAQGTRVLAKMVALGTDTSEQIWDSKTVKELSEENNSLHHLQTLKDANAMASKFSVNLKAKADERQSSVRQPPSTPLAEQQAEQAPQAGDSPLSDSSLASPDTGNAETKLSTSQVTDSNSLAQSIEQEAAVLEATSTTASPENPATSDSGSTTSTSSAGSPTLAEPAIAETTVTTTATTNQANSAQALLDEQASFLVDQANEHIDNLRLKTPKNNSALGALEQLQRIDPENPNIAIIERNIGEKYLSLADQKINKGEKSAAQKHLDSATPFIRDQSVLDKYSAKVAATRVAPPPAAAVSEPAQTTQTNNSDSNPPNTSTTASSGLTCNTRVKAVGLPLLGRTLTARQSLPLSKQVILDKSKLLIQPIYSNVRASSNKIAFEQPTSGKPVTFVLDVRADGNNTQLSITAKTPAGVSISKKNFKKEFCELISKL